MGREINTISFQITPNISISLTIVKYSRAISFMQ